MLGGRPADCAGCAVASTGAFAWGAPARETAGAEPTVPCSMGPEAEAADAPVADAAPGTAPSRAPRTVAVAWRSAPRAACVVAKDPTMRAQDKAVTTMDDT